MRLQKFDKCLLTGFELIEGPYEKEVQNKEMIWYKISSYGKEVFIFLCSTLVNELSNVDSECYETLNKIRNSLTSRWIRNSFVEIDKVPLHWNCNNIPANHRNLKDYITTDDCLPDNQFTRKDKLFLLEEYIFKTHKFDGQIININDSVEFLGSFQMRSIEEMNFYLNELSKKESIKLIGQSGVQITMLGLELMESKTFSNDNINNGNMKEKYEIALSFAGEQRKYVDEVAKHLKSKKIKVFYDNYEKVDLWGSDLYQHLNEVYRYKCQYCIIFISKEYASKLWTRHELKSAQARAITENREYILPVIFDDTKLPGVNHTIGYIDANLISPQELSKLAIKKLKNT